MRASLFSLVGLGALAVALVIGYKYGSSIPLINSI
jgi:hypothetical protein